MATESVIDAGRSSVRSGGADGRSGNAEAQGRSAVTDRADGGEQHPGSRSHGGLFHGALEFDSDDLDDDVVTGSGTGSGSDGAADAGHEEGAVADSAADDSAAADLAAAKASAAEGHVSDERSRVADEQAGDHAGSAGAEDDEQVEKSVAAVGDGSDPDVDGVPAGSQADDVGSKTTDDGSSTGIRTRITSPRAGMFDLEMSSGPEPSARSTDGTGTPPAMSRESRSAPTTDRGDEEELEWNYPVIIATGVAVVALVVIVLLILL